MAATSQHSGDSQAARRRAAPSCTAGAMAKTQPRRRPPHLQALAGGAARLEQLPEAAPADRGLPQAQLLQAARRRPPVLRPSCRGREARGTRTPGGKLPAHAAPTQPWQAARKAGARRGVQADVHAGRQAAAWSSVGAHTCRSTAFEHVGVALSGDAPDSRVGALHRRNRRRRQGCRGRGRGARQPHAAYTSRCILLLPRPFLLLLLAASGRIWLAGVGRQAYHGRIPHPHTPRQVQAPQAGKCLAQRRHHAVCRAAAPRQAELADGHAAGPASAQGTRVGGCCSGQPAAPLY